MAAWLVRLRTRLLLPEHDPEARATRDEADALRRDLTRRAAVQEAVGWLDARLQLGRDVFACDAAAAGAREAAEPAAAERAGLLRAVRRAVMTGPFAALVVPLRCPHCGGQFGQHPRAKVPR